MKKINLYFRKPPVGYKWIPGDRRVINFIRGLFGLNTIGGVEKVFINLCKGFDKLNVKYSINPRFKMIQPDEPVVVLGVGKYSLQGYNRPNPVIAGIGLMTHPSEWLDLFKEYPIAKYLQHSAWANDVYACYYGEKNCETWPAGIDNYHWKPNSGISKSNDVLIYNKIRWDREKLDADLRKPIIASLDKMGLSYKEIVYGQYKSDEYFDLLNQSRAMIFLCEHESQGLASCEALAMNVPIFAWDQGYCLDPNRFNWNSPVIPATSVPFFDCRCGMTFKDLDSFNKNIAEFWEKVGQNEFHPREYVLENLTLERSAQRMLDIIGEVYK